MKYSHRVFLSVLLLVVSTAAVLGTLLIYLSFRTARAQAIDAAVESYQMTRYTATAAGMQGEHLQMNDVVNVLRQMDTGRDGMLLLRQNGAVLFQSPAGDDAPDSALWAGVSRGKLVLCPYADPAGGHRLLVAGLLPVGDTAVELVGVYALEAPYAALQTQLATYRRLYAVVVLAGLLVAAALAFWLTRPVRRLSDAARQVAQGDFSVRAPERGSDEFSGLARDFNAMADRLVTEMQAQKDFTGAFAHELKTPMTSIIGYADLLRSRSLSDSQRRQAANYIFSEGKRLENLSLKLLDLLVLRRQDFPLTRQDVAAVVTQTAAEARPGLQAAKITLYCDAEPCPWDIEPDLLKTLLLNLIDNARKAMPDGGNIWLQLTATGRGFDLSVADEGVGMEPEQLGRITEAFYRVDKSRSRAQGGAGLGLAICAEIAALHGGQLLFASAPGEGTTVTLRVKRGRSQ
ncbi:MAG: HAMP domain-containing histidine kinase [Oscillospiraceae bacterium]|nr:HAMP domain-containing histidine kinase [Oscillospiraceae bacterium]